MSHLKWLENLCLWNTLERDLNISQEVHVLRETHKIDTALLRSIVYWPSVGHAAANNVQIQKMR